MLVTGFWHRLTLNLESDQRKQRPLECTEDEAARGNYCAVPAQEQDTLTKLGGVVLPLEWRGAKTLFIYIYTHIYIYMYVCIYIYINVRMYNVSWGCCVMNGDINLYVCLCDF